MALITIPTSGIKRIDWVLPEHTAFAIRSKWAPRISIADIGTVTGVSATVTLAAGDVARNAAWLAFFAALRGITNSFELPIVEARQPTFYDTCGVDGSGQTGNTLATKFWPASAPTGLIAGNFISVGSRLYTLTATPAAADSAGKTSLAFEPALAASPGDGQNVYIANPKPVMRLTSSKLGWGSDIARIVTPGSFGCEEVI